MIVTVSAVTIVMEKTIPIMKDAALASWKKLLTSFVAKTEAAKDLIKTVVYLPPKNVYIRYRDLPRVMATRTTTTFCWFL